MEYKRFELSANRKKYHFRYHGNVLHKAFKKENIEEVRFFEKYGFVPKYSIRKAAILEGSKRFREITNV